MGDILGSVVSSLLGIGSQKTKTPSPVVIQRAEPRQATTQTDPNTGEALKQARERAARLKARKGRSALRIDLNTGNSEGRAGLSVRK